MTFTLDVVRIPGLVLFFYTVPSKFSFFGKTPRLKPGFRRQPNLVVVSPADTQIPGALDVTRHLGSDCRIFVQGYDDESVGNARALEPFVKNATKWRSVAAVLWWILTCV